MKLTATSILIDFTPLMARQIVKPIIEKQNNPIKVYGTNNCTKKLELLIFILFWPCFNSKQKIAQVYYLLLSADFSILFTFRFFLLTTSQEVFPTNIFFYAILTLLQCIP